MSQHLVNFLFAMKLSSDFKYLQIMRELVLKFFVLSITLATPGTIFPVVREITHIIMYKNI
jgi:hypothetical protein